MDTDLMNYHIEVFKSNNPECSETQVLAFKLGYLTALKSSFNRDIQNLVNNISE